MGLEFNGDSVVAPANCGADHWRCRQAAHCQATYQEPELLHDPASAVPAAIRPTLDSLCSEVRELELRMKAVEKQLAELARDIPATKRLLSVPGIGLLTATALVAVVGDVNRFASGYFATSTRVLASERPVSSHTQRK